MDGPERSDDELVRLIGDGDEAALAALYRRYFGRVYDYALRISRDREVAALAVQSSLLRALGAARAGTSEGTFRFQLFAGAHYDLADRLRRRREPGQEPDESFSLVDPTLAGSPSLAGELPALGRAAWQACTSLRLDDYELLDLSVRQRLDAGEIAGIVRTRPETVERRLAAAEAELAASFTTLLLVARGRQACLDLDFLVGDEPWSPSLRRRVARHLATCLTCQRTCERYPGALAMLAAFTLAPAPNGWPETILTRLQEAIRSGAAPEPIAVRPVALPAPAPRVPRVREAAAGPAGGGFGEVAGGLIAGAGSRGPLIAVLAGAILVAAITVGALCAGGVFDSDGGPSGATPTVSPTPRNTRTPTASPTPTGTVTGTPVPLAPTATPLPPTAVPPTVTQPPPPPATPVPSATPILINTPTPPATP